MDTDAQCSILAVQTHPYEYESILRVLQSIRLPYMKGKNIDPYPPVRIQPLESKVFTPTFARQKTAGGC